MSKVYIRCDGGTDIGMGHVVRCLALAEMIRDHFDVIFVLQSTSENIHEMIAHEGYQQVVLLRNEDPTSDAEAFKVHLTNDDIVVLDSYKFKSEYQQTLKSVIRALVVVDDLHGWHHYADVVINHANGLNQEDYSCEPYTRILLGFDYLLIRPAFLKRRSVGHLKSKISKFLISMGAADVGNLTSKFAKALLDLKCVEQITLLVSSINPHLKEIHQLEDQNAERIKIISNINATALIENLLDTDFVICPASSISLESVSLQVGLLIGYTADNQMANYKALMEKNAALSLGNLHTLHHAEITSKIQYICERPELVNDQYKQQLALVDGKSPERILSVFQSL